MTKENDKQHPQNPGTDGAADEIPLDWSLLNDMNEEDEDIYLTFFTCDDPESLLAGLRILTDRKHKRK